MELTIIKTGELYKVAIYNETEKITFYLSTEELDEIIKTLQKVKGENLFKYNLPTNIKYQEKGL